MAIGTGLVDKDSQERGQRTPYALYAHAVLRILP